MKGNMVQNQLLRSFLQTALWPRTMGVASRLHFVYTVSVTTHFELLGKQKAAQRGVCGRCLGSQPMSVWVENSYQKIRRLYEGIAFMNNLAMLSPGIETLVAQVPQRRLGQSEEVARAICFLCTDSLNYVNGAELHINGGQHV